MKSARRRMRAGDMVEAQTHNMAGQTDGGVSALVVALPGEWRDALQAMLVEIPRIETIHLANDAASGIQAAAAFDPDLVVLDTDQLGGSDWTIAHRFKTACPHARSLVLTGELPDKKHLKTITADAVLVKGFSAAVLFQVLESLLSPGCCDSTPTDTSSQ